MTRGKCGNIHWETSYGQTEETCVACIVIDYKARIAKLEAAAEKALDAWASDLNCGVPLDLAMQGLEAVIAAKKGE